ncbi:alcohol acetyltransferase [Paenibacillus arenilitoris]|uniref:Alcohol acetyltransferase n=1 Tax=Paenibacillus arenilitoris TaxID=2772299 RepID=A0A927H9I7_9BACL|nr:alcohol acetyltransferase [Paenibacillus arenilitoris]MBD2872778.1 alcohol acetyltransferase [Paenibacillus arenilitoris]
MEEWYKLDHAGKLFPAVAGRENSSTYRLSLMLTSPVNPSLLQRALDEVITRFPLLDVELRNGLFWKFLRERHTPLTVEPETAYPCAPVMLSEENGSLVKVLFYGNKISVEIFHALTDGGGALEFLKTLVYQYLFLRGENVEDKEGMILPPASFARYAEAQDSFKAHYSSVPSYTRRPEALQIPGTRFTPYGHHVVHGMIHASRLNAAAKQRGVTLTAYLTAILIMAVYAATMPFNNEKRPIVISMPVNLRKIFPSSSLRNFFAVINIGVEMNEGMAFERVLEVVHAQMKEKTTKPYLNQAMASSMKYEKNLLSRFTPLKLKDLAIRYGFDHYGEEAKTLTLTNLGRIDIPSSMAAHVEAMETTMYPTAKSPINCAVCSMNEVLTITFARNIVESDVIMHFFRQLASLSGLDLRIVSNDWGMGA